MHTQRLLAIGALISLTLFSGCDKKPPSAAKAALTKTLDALHAKKMAAFKAHVVPAQRDKVTFDKPMVLGKKGLKAWPLDALIAMPFFSTFTKFSISQGYVDSKTQARYRVSFDFPDGSSGATNLIMVKGSDGWKLDMKKSVIFEKKMNGANAYYAVKLKKK